LWELKTVIAERRANRFLPDEEFPGEHGGTLGRYSDYEPEDEK
jgi:hypothetical protein